MVNPKIPPTNQTEPESVKRQIVLPFMKSVEISLKSIKVRFFRSLITTLSLVLAVSFLSYVRVGNDVANGLLSTREPRLRQAVIRSGYDVGPEDTNVGASPKQRWIIILSLLVCVVGIVNAQLMAVTERFREIGTMKCLGALDRFILHAGAGRRRGGCAGRRIFCAAWRIVTFWSDIHDCGVMGRRDRIGGYCDCSGLYPEPDRCPVSGNCRRQDAAG